MNPTDIIDRDSLRDDMPDFAPGDTLKVHVRVVEGNRERMQVFQGAVIRRQGSGPPGDLHGPQAELRGRGRAHFPCAFPGDRQDRGVARGDVRRAKLYYLRDRTGKAAKIKEKRQPSIRSKKLR